MGNVINAKANGVGEDIARFHLADGRWRVYVKPYTVDFKKELEDHMASKYVARSITITEENGTFCLTSNDMMYDYRDLTASLWFRIFWRFRCAALNTFATELEDVHSRKLRWCENKMNMEFNDENKENHFYVVSLSPQFIEATSLPRFHVPHCA